MRMYFLALSVIQDEFTLYNYVVLYIKFTLTVQIKPRGGGRLEYKNGGGARRLA